MSTSRAEADTTGGSWLRLGKDHHHHHHHQITTNIELLPPPQPTAINVNIDWLIIYVKIIILASSCFLWMRHDHSIKNAYWLPIYAPFYWTTATYYIGQFCACSLPCMRLLIAIGISIPYQLPQVGQLCGSLVECLLGRWKWAGAYSV